ncbi:MAG: amino acid adenylation domain-containing protein, partial [bacterium]|nr:amino acid adenylation domain-containing protein [bacterium]
MKYSGKEDIVVGSLTDGRSHPDLKKIIGVMITTLAIRNYPAGKKTFETFLQEVKHDSLRAFENTGYQFEELLKHIPADREHNRNPLFDTMLILQNYEWSGLTMEDLTFKPYNFEKNASTFELRLTAAETQDRNEIEIEIQYATRLFKKNTVKRLAGHLVKILKEVTANPAKTLAEIDILTAEERKQTLVDFNASAKDTGIQKTVHQQFELQAEKTPDKSALAGTPSPGSPYDPDGLTYRQLNERVNRLARYLRKKGVTGGHPVGLLLAPSIHIIVSMLAINKAGGTYMPVDPGYPAQRVAGILKDSGAAHLLTHSGINPETQAKDYPGKIINLDIEETEIAKENPANPGFEADAAPGPPGQKRNRNADTPIYIIYTSGSTGKPKGAAVYHGNFSNLIAWFITEFGLQADDGNILVTSVSFDLTQKNIYAPLVTGGRLTLPGLDHFDPAAILKIIDEQKITWLNCTPSMIYEIVRNSKAGELKKLITLRYLFLGGEPIVMKMMEEWIESPYFKTEIVNTYGPTECTDICAYYRAREPRKYYDNPVPTGYPVYNAQLYVMDPSQRPLPIGIPGELLIGGEGVGPGYINEATLTAEKFINVTIAADPDENTQPVKLYRTGDLVKWSPNGTIEFIDRVDHQVKIRGFRIELGEIENKLLNHEEIKAAVVLALTRKSTRDNAGTAAEKYLCAYVVSDNKLDVSALINNLGKQLPEYMIPAYFKQIPTMPLTPNGKIDRKQLPEPSDEEMESDTGFVEAGTEIEKKLKIIWQEILGVKKISIKDSFFRHGGDSLLAVKMVTHIRDAFKAKLPMKDFFSNPTIAELAVIIENGEKEQIRIEKAPPGTVIPLSFAQERLWFLQQLDSGSTSYYVPRALRLTGKLNTTIIENAFAEIIRRHEILKTTFPTVEGKPVQRLMEDYKFHLPIIDMTEIAHLEKTQKLQKVRDWLLKEGQKGFDFEKGPMARITLLKLTPEEHILVSTEHHLVHDGWTQGVLLKEFITLFCAYTEGKPSPLPELPVQYADFAYWQRNYIKGDVLENHLYYWKEKLTGLAPLLNLPVDHPRPPVITGAGKVKRCFLSRELTEKLMTFSAQKETTLFITMLALLKILLYRYTGTADICIGTGAANRRFKELENLIGMIINTLALRTQLDGDLNIHNNLQRTKTTCMEAYEHEDTPFEKIVEVVQPERSLEYMPIFQVMFSFMDTPAEYLSLPGLQLQVLETHNLSAKFDINILVEPPMAERMEETGGRIEVVWEYNTDLFDDSTIDRLMNHYNSLLEIAAVGEYEHEPVNTLPMMSDTEINRLLYEFNDTAADYPREKTIHQLFEEQVEKNPENICLVSEEKPVGSGQLAVGPASGIRLTYRQLNERANRLAYRLKAEGVTPGTIVAIKATRSTGLITGLMGILKAGAAYLPITPDYPAERINYMLADSSAHVYLTDEKTGDKKHEPNSIKRDSIKDPIVLDLNLETETRHPGTAVRLPASAPAYVIYTSGSTGRPKGVIVGHNSLVNFLHDMNRRFGSGFTADDNCFSLTAISFDVSVAEIFLPLSFGSTLCLMPEESILDVEKLSAWLMDMEITFTYIPPALLKAVYEKLSQHADRVKLNKMLVGVEPIPDTVLEDYQRLNPAMTILNAYGPTEATICATAGKYRSHEPTGRIVPIGGPLDNMQIYLLDKYGQVQPLGVAGELCIAGSGLALGYLNNPELTAERFVKASGPLEAFYRTGDQARWRPGGIIEFLGRIDQQVKIRGFRIEPGEIKNRLIEHDGVRDVIVMDREDENKVKYICAYIIPAINDDFNELTRQLRNHLTGQLPGYMIPSYFVEIAQIPLTPNGKVDRRALPEPQT